eukprot:INCI5373.1.p1 GENE.INCI5373.1~~INCI5373.1.p1  ORF type:complete len:575 (-),score=74.60 INCI5373.1:1101-2720(-)
MDNDDSENMFAGAVAGMIAETIMHPFDTLNTRLKVFSDAGGSSGDNAGAGKGAQSGTGSIRIAGTRGMPSTVLRYSVPRSAVMQFFPAHSMSFHSGTMIGAMYRIVSLEGWRALYAGVPATLIGAIPSTALYFSAYEAAKRFGEASYNDFADAAQAATGVRPDNEMVYLPAVYFTAGAFGELASSSVYVPFEVVKSRLQMGANPHLSSGGWIRNQTNYRSTFDAFSLIWQGEGIRGLYSGWRANIVLDCCFAGTQFLLYELLKQRMQRERARLGASEPDSPLPLGPTFLIGALAGGVAAVLTNPLEVVVTRLMVQGHSLPESVPNIPASARTAEVDHVSSMPTSTGSQRASPVSAHAGVGGHHSVGVSRPDHHSPFTRYNGIIHGLRTIFRQEGMAGLLRGVVPRMVSNAPMAALTFAVYENIKQWFSTNREENMRRSNDEEGWAVDDNPQNALREEAQNLPFPNYNILHRDYDNAVRVTCRSASNQFQGGDASKADTRASTSSESCGSHNSNRPGLFSQQEEIPQDKIEQTSDTRATK